MLKVDELSFIPVTLVNFVLKVVYFSESSLLGGYACSWIFVTLAKFVFLPQGEGGMVSVESPRCIFLSGYACSRMMLDSFFPAAPEKVTRINFDLIT